MEMILNNYQKQHWWQKQHQKFHNQNPFISIGIKLLELKFVSQISLCSLATSVDVNIIRDNSCGSVAKHYLLTDRCHQLE